MMVTIVTYLLMILSTALGYYLCLAFIGASKRVKETILPILIMFAITFIAKVAFPVGNELFLPISLCSWILLVKLFNREISWLLSVLGIFLAEITMIFSSFIWPFVKYLAGASVTAIKPNTWEWVYFALLEDIIPLIVLILLKAKKISLMKLLAK